MATPEPTAPHAMPILAHELVHAAGRTSQPRFFHDRNVDAEERRARSAESPAAAPRPTRAAPAEMSPAPSGDVTVSQGSTMGLIDEPDDTRSAASRIVDLDDLLDSISERLLAEIDRRGGRYAGVF